MKFTYHDEIEIRLSKVSLKGDLSIPVHANGIIIFSHGSGSSRLSPRNRMVAHYLQKNNFATLLFDLLTEEEDRHFENRFDIGLLTRRLIDATEWLENVRPEGLRIGYFGASTGAASALRAAAFFPHIQAVVSRGGRPDLAMDILHEVYTPTMLIVGGRDEHVLELNEKAYSKLNCEKKLEVIDGASHLFEEEGAMDLVCEKATDWFKKYMHKTKMISLN
jgi:putative phosphoribosyl transferase